MSKIMQGAAESGPTAPPRARSLGVSGGWWAGAARALGISAATDGGAGRAFDFTAMHRSLSSLERKPPAGE